MPQNGTTVALPYEDEVVVRLLGSLVRCCVFQHVLHSMFVDDTVIAGC